MQSKKGEHKSTVARLKIPFQIDPVVPLRKREQQLYVEENEKKHQRFEAGDSVVFIGDIDVRDRHPADDQCGDVAENP